MPKSTLIDPKEVRKASNISFKDIPVNQYKGNFKDELKKHGKEKMMNIYRDMSVIREFETMLHTIKTEGVYQGLEYNHPGPAHLSIGQEACAVGQSFHLDENDFMFGSHRSHGEILAKVLSVIEKLK